MLGQKHRGLCALLYIDCGLSLQLQERSARWKAATCGRFELRRDCEDGILAETAKKDLLGLR